MFQKLFKSRKPELRRKEYDTKYNMILRDWLRYHQKDIVFDKVSWMGKPILKNVMDAWIYQEIMFEVKPDIIIEIGSKYGGSTLFFASMFDLMGKGQVISIDINRSVYDLEHPRVVEFTGSSSDDDIVRSVSDLCIDKKVLVIHDGDHSEKQVAIDLINYAPLVSVGSYYIVEDGIVDLYHEGDGLGFKESEPGPLPAVEKFVAANKSFVIDMSKERYLMTYNPCGYLKRISE